MKKNEDNKKNSILDRLFNGIDMTWKKVIIFAIITGIYTGLINQVPFLKNTSFRDIAITFEMWILFAIIIMSNCKKPIESALKTFVFFLISQPLVYIVEIPFVGVEVLNYYRNWIIWTILVLPMAFFGNYLRKGNFFSLIVLLPACFLLYFMGIYLLRTTVFNFPYHLLTVIFCIGSGFLYILYFIKNKKHKIIGIVLSILMILGMTLYVKPFNYNYEAYLLYSSDGTNFNSNSNVYFEGKNLGTMYISSEQDDYILKVQFNKTGKSTLVIENEDNTKYYFDVVSDFNAYNVKQIKRK